ncbi:MAG: element excision factor XisI family protein [Bacteroidota bacterium]
MGKAKQYKAKVVKVLSQIASWTSDEEDVVTRFIQDNENGHYLLFDVGWHNDKRIYLPFIDIDVTSEGKVWLQHDGTDLKIAQLLHEEGIPKSDIVIGFQSRRRRELMDEFAVD